MIKRGMPRTWPIVVGAVVGAVVAAAAGCTGSDATSSPTLTPLPSTSSVASPAPPTTSPTTASPAPVAKAGPPPKTPFTKQGAELFVRSYYLTLNAVIAAPPGSERSLAMARTLSAYGAKGCECRYTQNFFLRHVRAGDHFVGKGYGVDKVEVKNMAGNTAVVASTFSLSRVLTVDPGGRTVDIQRQIIQETDTFVVAYNGATWRMTRQLVGEGR